MQNEKTLWELLQAGSITIPAIQRDYAQGRKSQDARRTDFLIALFNALKSDPVKNVAPGLHLDFIYGRTRPVYKKMDFIPVDGQQRLTTLGRHH